MLTVCVGGEDDGRHQRMDPIARFLMRLRLASVGLVTRRPLAVRATTDGRSALAPT
jgi:hypothetical protein